MNQVADYTQEQVDRACRALAWASGNETTAYRLANMSVDESGMGSREPSRLPFYLDTLLLEFGS